MSNIKSQIQISNLKSKTEKIIIYLILLLIVIFNFYLYRGEFKVLSDPNDNTFHYALIDEAKNIWKDIFSGKLSPLYLFDSWNERWAEGFSLSQYYSHLPQAIISLFSIIFSFSTFKLFVILRTTLLILLPLTFFLGVRIMGFSSGLGLIVAFFSQAIFTDGLYGLDLTSYLWRGWGLSAQLIAVFFLPLAFTYSLNYLENNKDLGKAIIFNFIIAQSHFGMLYLLLLAYPIYWLFSLERWQEVGKRTFVLLLSILISLSYFIIPFFLNSNYRNFSLWDPIWKFDLWGLNQIIIWFANGDLFDFNRFPFLTILVIGGLFWGLISGKKLLRYLVAIFGLYFILFIGHDIIGPLVNIIPGLNEYHLHRVIVMVQFIGLLIAGNWLFDLLKLTIRKKNLILTILFISFGFYSIYLIEKPIINYIKDNNAWIERANKDYQKNYSDYQIIVNNLKKLPSARVYAGRPGNWGKNFKIGDTQIYMALSREGFPIIGFLPQSWSPNSDAEQFFDEENPKHYDLYNVGYLVFPIEKKPPQFAKLVIKKGKFSLYKVNSEGWFTLGKSSLEVMTKKTNMANISHLWFYSSLFINKDYPVIALNNEKYTFVNNTIKMLDLNNYNSNMNIWQTNPFIESDNSELPIINKQEIKTDKGYLIKLKMNQNCSNCVLILKQTFHPDWLVLVNGKKQPTFPVFPFFIGIQLNKSGNYKIEAIYQPSILKYFLIICSILYCFGIVNRSSFAIGRKKTKISHNVVQQ